MHGQTGVSAFSAHASGINACIVRATVLQYKQRAKVIDRSLFMAGIRYT
jgi:hypothetical protein